MNESPEGEAEEYDETYSPVRPYTVTRGRTRPSSNALPLEALVRKMGPARPGLGTEMRRILDLTDGQYMSIAELSAHVHLPLGVVRVLVGDLADERLVRIDGLNVADNGYNPTSTLSVLESVLNGISAL